MNHSRMKSLQYLIFPILFVVWETMLSTVNLESAQEKRPLSPHEQELRKELKMKTLGLASLSRTIARQRSRIHFLAEGDANTRFFQIQACHRRRKNYIHTIKHNDNTLVTESDKRAVVDDYYESIMSTHRPRSARLNLDFLGLPTRDLASIDCCFSENEIYLVHHS